VSDKAAKSVEQANIEDEVLIVMVSKGFSFVNVKGLELSCRVICDVEHLCG
jgi:hypothetical protein